MLFLDVSDWDAKKTDMSWPAVLSLMMILWMKLDCNETTWIQSYCSLVLYHMQAHFYSILYKCAINERYCCQQKFHNETNINEWRLDLRLTFFKCILHVFKYNPVLKHYCSWSLWELMADWKPVSHEWGEWGGKRL